MVLRKNSWVAAKRKGKDRRLKAVAEREEARRRAEAAEEQEREAEREIEQRGVEFWQEGWTGMKQEVERQALALGVPREAVKDDVVGALVDVVLSTERRVVLGKLVAKFLLESGGRGEVQEGSTAQATQEVGEQSSDGAW